MDRPVLTRARPGRPRRMITLAHRESTHPMPYPNAIVIGAPRSGTTSLYEYLGQHPDVFVSPVKETRFFAYEGQALDFQGPADPYTINRDSITDPEAYQALFAGQSDESVVAEASPIYLSHPRAPERIKQHVPHAKMIVSLRNPVSRAYSDFLNMVRLGWEPLRDFETALDREDDRIAAGWGPFYQYRSKGYYGRQMARYLDRFAEEQLLVFPFKELQSDPERVMKRVYSFLGVSTAVTPDVEQAHNRSGLPRSEVVHSILTHPVTEAVFRGPLRSVRQRWRDRNTRHEKPPMPPAARRRLVDAYRDDVEQLERLLDLDLSHWLQRRPEA